MVHHFDFCDRKFQICLIIKWANHVPGCAHLMEKNPQSRKFQIGGKQSENSEKMLNVFDCQMGKSCSWL